MNQTKILQVEENDLSSQVRDLQRTVMELRAELERMDVVRESAVQTE